MFGSFSADLSINASRRALGQGRRFKDERAKRLRAQESDVPDDEAVFQQPHNGRALPVSALPCTSVPGKDSGHVGVVNENDADHERQMLKRRAPESSIGADSTFSFSKWVRDVTSKGSVITSISAAPSTLTECAWSLSGLLRWFTEKYTNGRLAGLLSQPSLIDVGSDVIDGTEPTVGSTIQERTAMCYYDTRGADGAAALRDLISYCRDDPCHEGALGDVDENVLREDEIECLRRVGTAYNTDRSLYRPWVLERAEEWEQLLDAPEPNKQELLRQFMFIGYDPSKAKLVEEADIESIKPLGR